MRYAAAVIATILTVTATRSLAEQPVSDQRSAIRNSLNQTARQ
jgi:hypothetical protein